ncbi:hypothetical protein [Actinoplanes sp. NPDC026619]|uniref:hypothetical protein n=1 Tax=Actinoplanes sp. NPDC026619 TaxID=3155798 RepID=UPI0033CD4F94
MSEILTLPLSFGWTPSVVFEPVLKPLHWSTTVIGDAEVLLPLAQPGMALLRLITRCPQSEQPLGFIGRIFATRIFMADLLARIWSTSLL